jgi:hypothetical protein
MCELKKNGNVFTGKSVGTGPSSYEKRIYWAVISQKSRNTGLDHHKPLKVPEILLQHSGDYPAPLICFIQWPVYMRPEERQGK